MTAPSVTPCGGLYRAEQAGEPMNKKLLFEKRAWQNDYNMQLADVTQYSTSVSSNRVVFVNQTNSSSNLKLSIKSKSLEIYAVSVSKDVATYSGI